MASVQNIRGLRISPYPPLCLGEDNSIPITYSKWSQVISSPISLPSLWWFACAYFSKRFELGSKRIEKIQWVRFMEHTTAPNRPCRRAHSLIPIRPQDIVCKSHICLLSKVGQILPQRNGVMKWNEIRLKRHSSRNCSKDSKGESAMQKTSKVIPCARGHDYLSYLMPPQSTITTEQYIDAELKKIYSGYRSVFERL